MLPFILIVLSIVHIFFLHEVRSSSKLFKNVKKKKKLIFFLFKDINNVLLILLFYFFIFFFFDYLGDPENFIHRNKIVTPVHIKPEWYFLWIYAILRSVPSKLGGVLLLVGRILVLFKLNLTKKNIKSFHTHWELILIFIILSFLGGEVIEDPYLFFRQFFTFYYFVHFFFFI